MAGCCGLNRDSGYGMGSRSVGMFFALGLLPLRFIAINRRCTVARAKYRPCGALLQGDALTDRNKRYVQASRVKRISPADRNWPVFDIL